MTVSASASASGFRNKGSEPQQLQCCDFAGWDSQEQFTFILDLSTVNSLDGKSPLLQPGKTWLLNGVAQLPNNPYRAYTRARGVMLGTIGGYGFCPMPALPPPEEDEDDEEQLQRDEVDGDGEGTDAVYEELRQAAGQKSATRSLERDLEIAPGQKVSVTVACRGK